MSESSEQSDFPSQPVLDAARRVREAMSAGAKPGAGDLELLCIWAEEQDIKQGDPRERRVAAIQRTRLGGADRITIDDPGTPPYKRYAHIMANGLATNLYTTDDPMTTDDAYDYEGSDWRRVGVIDLDTGGVVDTTEADPREATR